jgi:hypothetical protein
MKNGIYDKLKPWLGSLIILPFVIYYSIKAGEFTFIDYINLLIHEGGHGIFRLFGEFIYFLGGTLMQIIIPSLFIYYFLSNRKKIGAQISIVWLGENLLNISRYISDARAKELPLLGGSKVIHDWGYLLGKTGLLQYDTVLGTAVLITGYLIFIAALLLPLFYKEYKQVDLDLKI